VPCMSVIKEVICFPPIPFKDSGGCSHGSNVGCLGNNGLG
jgi:uncharacterized protein (DUF779 family)